MCVDPLNTSTVLRAMRRLQNTYSPMSFGIDFISIGFSMLAKVRLEIAPIHICPGSWVYIYTSPLRMWAFGVIVQQHSFSSPLRLPLSLTLKETLN